MTQVNNNNAVNNFQNSLTGNKTNERHFGDGFFGFDIDIDFMEGEVDLITPFGDVPVIDNDPPPAPGSPSIFEEYGRAFGDMFDF